MDIHTLVTLSPIEGDQVQKSLYDIFSGAPYTLIYFYPKDNTPGCTLEGRDFTQLASDFRDQGIQIVGVSPDSHISHKKFQSECGIALDLIADDGYMVDAFEVMGEKNMYGKIIFGLRRSSFLLDQNGRVVISWRNVRAKGHAEKVLREIRAFFGKNLQKTA